MAAARAGRGDAHPVPRARPALGLSRVDVLLTHLHMDHIIGLGFSGPLYTPGCPAGSSSAIRARERVSIGAFHVRAARSCHPGPTVGYRIETKHASLAYLPDHEPALGARSFPIDAEWTSGLELAEGVDLLLHDAQYTMPGLSPDSRAPSTSCPSIMIPDATTPPSTSRSVPPWRI